MKKKPKIRKCRVCGCTDDRACKGGCYWVAVDLCSKCFDKSNPRRNLVA